MANTVAGRLLEVGESYWWKDSSPRQGTLEAALLQENMELALEEGRKHHKLIVDAQLLHLYDIRLLIF